MSLDEMRRRYTMSGLDHTDLADSPIEQFTNWLDSAKAVPSPDWFEVNAMTLSTADASGYVSSRIVLLKGFSDQGFNFYTNYQSQKGKQLLDNDKASLLFYWGHLERQIRINGTVKKLPFEQSQAYFHSRPRGSQLGAIASAQSDVIAERSMLEQKMRALEAQYADQEVPMPEWWGGYVLAPTEIEFWQGRDNRLHDRFRYTQHNHEWLIERLAP